jgi:hypothetical protein
MVIPDSLSLFTPEARLSWAAEAFDEQGLLAATHGMGRVEYHAAHGRQKRKNVVDRFQRV